MKTKTILAIATLATLALTGCSNNDEPLMEPNNNFPQDGVIRVTTSLNELQSRAGMTSDNLTQFYLNIEKPGNTTYSYHAMMLKKDTEGNTTNDWRSYEPTTGIVYTPINMLWQNKTEPIYVSAMAKSGLMIDKTIFTNGIRTTVSLDQTIENNVIVSDLLYMPRTEVNPATPGTLTADGKINIALSHRFAKLSIKVTLGTEFNTTPGTATNPIEKVDVKGTITSASFYPLEDKLTVNLIATPKAVSPFAAAYTPGAATTTTAVAEYECILVPQTVEADEFSVSFTIDGKKYVWVSPKAVLLEKGTKYALKLVVGKDITTVSTFTASAWETETNGSTATE